MAKQKITYTMVSDWTYVVSGDHGHYESECKTRKDAESTARYQKMNLRRYGTDIKIEIKVS